MTNENNKRYPDRINKMLLEDPYRPLHNWNIHRNENYLDNLKQSTGIEPNKERWSVSEIEQLEENMRRYQNINPNVQIFKLLYKGNSKTKRKVFKETNFWDLISYNLCRKLTQIKVSITDHFMKTAGYKTGPFSKQEFRIIRELVKQHGKNWPLISNLMNRSANKLSITYNDNIRNNINSGPWHKDEKNKFLCIAKQLMLYNKLNQLPLFKFNWRVVSDFVQTRSSRVCKGFTKINKQMIENIFIAGDTNSNSTVKEAMILYIYFSTNHSTTELIKKELLLLFDEKFNECKLQKEYNDIISMLPNGDIKDGIRLEHKNLIEKSEDLVKRINFENVVQTMSSPRTIAWLKAKYFILVNENIEKFKEKTSEQIISILHDKYCKTKLKVIKVTKHNHL